MVTNNQREFSMSTNTGPIPVLESGSGHGREHERSPNAAHDPVPQTWVDVVKTPMIRARNAGRVANVLSIGAVAALLLSVVAYLFFDVETEKFLIAAGATSVLELALVAQHYFGRTSGKRRSRKR
jgi:hypothetical protein